MSVLDVSGHHVFDEDITGMLIKSPNYTISVDWTNSACKVNDLVVIKSMCAVPLFGSSPFCDNIPGLGGGDTICELDINGVKVTEFRWNQLDCMASSLTAQFTTYLKGTGPWDITILWIKQDGSGNELARVAVPDGTRILRIPAYNEADPTTPVVTKPTDPAGASTATGTEGQDKDMIDSIVDGIFGMISADPDTVEKYKKGAMLVLAGIIVIEVWSFVRPRR